MKTLKYLGIAARSLIVAAPLLRALHGITLAGSLLILASCGGGGSGGGGGGSGGGGSGGGGSGGPGTTLPAPLQGTITGLSRVVTNQNYTYTGVAASGAASNYGWAWGDGSTGSTSASSSTQTKTWRAAGNYTASLSFIDSTNNTASVSQAVAVIDHPISSGAQHSCAILSDNTVACWGQNNAGQLGNSANVDTNIPVVVPGLNNVISLTAHGYGTCVAKTDGSVWCWGGYSFTNTPQQVAGITNVVALASTWEHVCALQRAGTVKCFGNTSQGALGDGVVFHNQADPAVQVSNLTDAVSIAAGGSHTCAIKADQTVVCWGYGALGAVGPSTSAIATTPVAVAGVNNAMSLALGEDLSCAVITDGSVMCWGNSGSSLSATYARAQGLTGNTITTATPQVMPGLSNVVSMSFGRYHACALKTNNTVECWGTIGGGTKQLTPVAVMTSATETLKNVQAIGSGWGQTCAIKFNGTAYCWGSNSNGQLGNATTVNSTVAQSVLMSAFNAGGINLPSIAVASGEGRNCAIKSDNTVACWGSGYEGRLGNGSISDSNTPVSVKGLGGTGLLSNVSAISLGRYHSCALRIDGSVACWGGNNIGALGVGSISNYSNIPVLANVTGVVAISAGESYTCAIKSDDTTVCWGYGGLGQLGNGVSGNGTYDGELNPVTVLGVAGIGQLHGAISLSSFNGTTCALKIDGTAVCWGFGYYGTLGNGTTDFIQATPVAVTGLTGATNLAVGEQACAVKSDHTIVCWGSGYTGNGSTTLWPPSTTPVAVSGVVDALSITSYERTPCVLKMDGTVACWGLNYAGGLGNGSNTVAYTIAPAVSGLNNISAIAGHCALKIDGEVWCWGNGLAGQLGNGANSNATVPVRVSATAQTTLPLMFWK
jgi:alpha-tubulin suppressor-like RCC1 family protein